ncbi:LysE family translocator [Ramlibacter sp. WS9]|uniref:LysE family translocator n=1 Tax=Ramlibacter sp. WS9 TaxID=1882741 RepID=UPI001E598C02|nr:LysE family translocator [Ramlibacter sp. WS9]
MLARLQCLLATEHDEMDSLAHLWLFFLMVFGIIVLPGMDMAFVLASSLRGGRHSGLLAVAGIIAGGVCHVGASALGIGLLLQVVPGLFNAVLLAGAAYIAWIGISLLRSASAAGALPKAYGASTPMATFRQGMLTSLLNPKAYLFMFAVFPQFFRPQLGSVWTQALVLGVIISLTQAAVYGTVAVAAGGAGAGLDGRPRLQVLIVRAAGAMLIFGAALTAMQGWRGI